MSRFFAILALVSLLLPPGVCTCGAMARCCPIASEIGQGSGVCDDHFCRHHDGKSDVAVRHHENHRAPWPKKSPEQHAPNCLAVTSSVSRAVTTRINTLADEFAIDHTAQDFVASPSVSAFPLPLTIFACSDRPIYLKVRALLI